MWVAVWPGLLAGLAFGDAVPRDEFDCGVVAAPDSVAVLEAPFRVAVTTVAGMELCDATIGEKDAWGVPAGTVTLGATVIALLLLDKETIEPPEGAEPVRVTLQVEVQEPATLVSEQFNVLSGMVVIVKSTDLDFPFKVTETET
jgi:hypothetical protein